MCRSPESLIARLRNRKAHVITYGILSVICLGLLTMAWCALTDMMAGLVPAEGNDLILHAVLSQQLLVGIGFLQTVTIILALGFGAAMAALISELMAFTKRDLLVYLWDRVRALEHHASIGTGGDGQSNHWSMSGIQSEPLKSPGESNSRQTSRSISSDLARMWHSHGVCFPVGVLAAGYGLLLLGKFDRGIDGSFLCFTTPAVTVALVAFLLFHWQEIKSRHRMLLCYAVLFAVAFPLARESTHYDPIQVTLTIGTFALTLFLFILSLAVWLRNRGRDRIEYRI